MRNASKSFLLSLTIFINMGFFAATAAGGALIEHPASAFTPVIQDGSSTVEVGAQQQVRKAKPKPPSLAQMGFTGRVVSSAPSAALISEQEEGEKSWESAQLDSVGNIIVHWENNCLTPDRVFELLKDDETNRSKVPTAIWTHILNCVQFQDSYITRTTEMGFAGEAASGATSTTPAFQEEEGEESWESAQRDEIGDIITPWNNRYLTPDTVFDLLKDDEKNRLKVPAAVWTHVLNCVQFQHSFVTRMDDICLPNLKNKLLSKENARLELLVLQQGNYDLERWVPDDVLKFVGPLA